MDPSTVQSQLEKVGYFATQELATEIGLLLARKDTNNIRTMLLDGPAGSGKTFLAKSVANMTGATFVYIQAHSGSSPEDFLVDANIVTILRAAAGDTSAVRCPTDVISMGFIPLIFQLSNTTPVIGLVDEIDKASRKVDAFFLSALQEGEVIIKGIDPALVFRA